MQGTGLVLDEENVQFKFMSSFRETEYLFTIKKLIELKRTDNYSTTRELYYQNIRKFNNDRIVAALIRNICCTLHLKRLDCNIVASPKGYVYGDLVYTYSDNTAVDCQHLKSGVPIPNEYEDISFKHCNAKFVLVVEKHATFHQLIQHEVLQKFPMIVITGCGFPDLRTRVFARKLWTHFKLPFLGLFDCDVYGFEILCVYKYGSYKQSYQNASMVVPDIRLVGVLPEDVEQLELKGPKFNGKEIKRLNELKCRPYMEENKTLYQQLLKLEQIGRKVEIQSLSALGKNYLVDKYLPDTIKNGRWV